RRRSGRPRCGGIKRSACLGARRGSNDAPGYSLDFDTTGHVDEGGTLMYRFVGEHGDRDTFRDYVAEKSTYLAPSVTWSPGGAGGSTTVTLQAEHRRSNSTFDQGLVAPDRDASLIAPITTFYGEPGQYREETGTTVSAFISPAFDNGWQWNTSLRSVDYESEQEEFSHVGIRNDGRTLNRRARHLKTERGYDSFDTNLT